MNEAVRGNERIWTTARQFAAPRLGVRRVFSLCKRMTGALSRMTAAEETVRGNERLRAVARQFAAPQLGERSCCE